MDETTIDDILGKPIGVRPGVFATLRRTADGWYEATSEEVPGLYITHTDWRVIVDDLPTVIDWLQEADAGHAAPAPAP